MEGRGEVEEKGASRTTHASLATINIDWLILMPPLLIAIIN